MLIQNVYGICIPTFINNKNPNFLFKVKNHNNTYNNFITSNLLLHNLYSLKLDSNWINSSKKYNKFKLSSPTYTSLRLSFSYLRLNLFNLFFNKSGVEIPKQLLNLKSLVWPKNQINIYKFNNYLMRKGSFIKEEVK